MSSGARAAADRSTRPGLSLEGPSPGVDSRPGSAGRPQRDAGIPAGPNPGRPAAGRRHVAAGVSRRHGAALRVPATEVFRGSRLRARRASRELRSGAMAGGHRPTAPAGGVQRGCLVARRRSRPGRMVPFRGTAPRVRPDQPHGRGAPDQARGGHPAASRRRDRDAAGASTRIPAAPPPRPCIAAGRQAARGAPPAVAEGEGHP